MRIPAIAVSVAVITFVSGCAPAARLGLERRTGGNAALFAQFRIYDGKSGAEVEYAQLASAARSADVVLFGESHGDPVCNALEAQLYADMLRGGPTSLVMEFFERDVQSSVDKYLAGKLPEPEFAEAARTSRGYEVSHRPLVEMARAAGVNVIAANTPRRLVRQYRESERPYGEFLAGLTPEDRRWLPPSNELLTGPYRDRFVGMMQGHAAAASTPASAPASAPADETAESEPAESQPAEPEPPKPGMKPEDFYRAQMLWDETMAESLATTRMRAPGDAALLIVGSFHVADGGGLTRKFSARRPNDRTLIVIHQGADDGDLSLPAEDRGTGDFVIRGITKRESPGS